MKARATVMRKKSGISRSYRAGDDGTTWVVDFEKNLRAGVFRAVAEAGGRGHGLQSPRWPVPHSYFLREGSKFSNSHTSDFVSNTLQTNFLPSSLTTA